ncbi:MAG: symporter-like protein [Hyphomicrobiales bacterium]|nr:symporter-like protein [Hyphomicrobiales bacterium]
MGRQPTDDELTERAAIDGRVAFAMAAFAAAAGLIVLIDRVGAPERLIAAAGPAALLAGVALIGLLLRTMRVSRFYAAGRAVPPAYAGVGALAIALALIIPFTPPVSDRYSGVGVFAGFAGGLVCALLVSGPYLRKTGAFSLSDLVASRFERLPVRLGVAAVVGATALIAAFAGYETAVSGLSTIAGVDRPAAAVAVGLVLVLAVGPGGQSGAIWIAATTGGVFIACFALPILLLALHKQTIPLPYIGDPDAWRTAIGRIEAWQGDAGEPASLSLSAGMALGMASFAPLIAPLVGVRDRIAAVRAGFGGLFWGLVAAALVCATVAASTLALVDTMVGRRPERLPDAIYAASATRLVAICGVSAPSPSQARAACQRTPNFAGELRPQDIDTRGVFLLTALPPLAALGAAMSGLVWAAIVGVGIALASAGLLAAATALGNDAIHHVRDRSALTSRRLAIARAILLAAIVMGGLLTGARELEPRVLIGVALALSATTLAPLMALALWPRARAVDALFALATGLVAAESLFATGEPTVHRLAHGAVLGFFAAVAVGVATSFVGGGDRSRGRAFLAGLLQADGDVLEPDKGA